MRSWGLFAIVFTFSLPTIDDIAAWVIPELQAAMKRQPWYQS